MSRTVHVELTPSRRSKRLIQNGYYQLPAGESPRKFDVSSEDDDDTASVDSNNSSIFSERAVHYNEMSSALHHRRRRRKRDESPRAGQTLQDSPGYKRSMLRTTQLSPLVHTSKNLIQSSSAFAGSNQSSLLGSHTQRKTESQTVVASYKSTTQKYLHAETSAIFQSSVQASANVGYDEYGRVYSRNALTRNKMQHPSGEGDVGTGQDGKTAFEMSASNQPVNHKSVEKNVQFSMVNKQGDNNQFLQKSFSDSEEDVSDVLRKPVQTVPLFSEKVSVLFLHLFTVFCTALSHIGGLFYKATLSIFVFDVWWLSRTSGSLIQKLARAVLAIFLLLLFLAGTYMVAENVIGHTTEILPLQSIGGLFFSLSSAFKSAMPFSGEPGQEYVKTMPPQALLKEADLSRSEMKTNLEVEELLSKMELQFADRLVEMHKVITKLHKDQQDYNKKQQEAFAKTLSALEVKLLEEIANQNDLSNRKNAESLKLLKDEIVAIRMNHTKSSKDMRSQVEQLRGLLSDRSQAAAKLDEFKARLESFDHRLTALNNMMIKSMQDYNKQGGNTTYMKEIAKIQFVESFLRIIKTDYSAESSPDRNSLHYLFIAWLRKQGFARVDEIERDLNDVSVNISQTSEALEQKLLLQIETLKKSLKKRASSLTLDRIVERPSKVPSETDFENQVKDMIRDELDLYSADRIGQADHALESAGGYIESTRCSESYNRKTALVSILGIPIYYNINTPRSVIQSSTMPGECWAFKGSEGYVVIALSGAVQPASFTMEHIPRELSPHGKIDSAPKEFSVYGLASNSDYDGKELGRYRYEVEGSPIQQFPVLASQPVDFFSHIELRVTSNWGHPEYTCLYRFRVHGTRRENAEPLV